MFLRKNSTESPIFKDLKRLKKISKFPIKDVLFTNWQSVLMLASLSGVAFFSTYVIRGYFLEYLEYLTGQDMFFVICVSLIFLIITLPIFGFISDKICFK